MPPASRKDAHPDIQIGFPVLPGPLSQIRVDLFKQWLQACDQYHPICHRDYGRFRDSSQRDSEEEALSRLPTRVIDIDFGTNLRLKDFSNVDRYNEDVRYITLSHCWGKLPDERKRQYCLTTDNINQRFNDSFSIAELPKTFRDAIIMTHRLGIRYLWIDSLCIIQYGDNLADWRKEAVRMETVFRNAYCTIAATAAKDSDTGFLPPDSDPQRASTSSTSSPEYLSLHSPHGPVHISPVADDFETDVNNGLLNTRAWVLQERALSARTIHFTTSQAYFECGHGVRCETLTRMQNSKNLFLSDPDFPRSLRLRAGRDRVLLFQDLFKTYSRLGITVPTDKSLAIAGLEKRLAEVFGTRCCFGVVERYLHRSLLWERSREEKQRRENNKGSVGRITYPEGSEVPSWSWMAWERGVDYLDIDTQGVEWDQDVSLAEDGKTLRARVRRFSKSCRTERNDSCSVVVFEDGAKRGDSGWIRFDRKRRVHLRKHRCVVVGREETSYRPGLLARSRDGWDYYVLVVAQVEIGGRRVFERIGVGCIPVGCISFRGSERVTDTIV